MKAKVLHSTEARFLPRTRQGTKKRRGYLVEFGLKVAAAALGALGLGCAMLCTYLYQSNGYSAPSGFYTALKIIESACAAAGAQRSSWLGFARRRRGCGATSCGPLPPPRSGFDGAAAALPAPQVPRVPAV
jgi:hypothetical protein